MVDNRTVPKSTGRGTYITNVYVIKRKREHCGGIDCTVECQVLQEKVKEEVVKVYSASVKWPNEEKTHHHHWISILS